MEENVAIWNRTWLLVQNVKMPVNVSSASVDIRVPWYYHHCTATVLFWEGKDWTVKQMQFIFNKIIWHTWKALHDILLLGLPVGSHACCRWYEKTQPLQVKTPASPRSRDGEPSQKWPRAGSWCSSGHGPGKRLVCKVDNEISSDSGLYSNSYMRFVFCALWCYYLDPVILS